MEKPDPLTLEFSQTRHSHCINCDEDTSKWVTPRIILSMRGGDNIFRHEVCKECGGYQQSYMTAAIMRCDVPTKRRYDNFHHEIDLEDVVQQVSTPENV